MNLKTVSFEDVNRIIVAQDISYFWVIMNMDMNLLVLY
jgi:hypothetical protein